MQFLVNAEGGLTTAGYAVSIVAAVILFWQPFSSPERYPAENRWEPNSWLSVPWPLRWALSLLI